MLEMQTGREAVLPLGGGAQQESVRGMPCCDDQHVQAGEVVSDAQWQEAVFVSTDLKLVHCGYAIGTQMISVQHGAPVVCVPATHAVPPWRWHG